MKILGVILMASVFMVACDSEQESSMMENMVIETPPADADKTGMGTFSSYAHNLSGDAILLSDDMGQKVVRLENFTMTAGPDVYVFVSKSNNYSQANVIEVAQLKIGYVDSDINFNFTAANYTSEYKFVLVYCVQYNSLFGFAELK